MSTRAVHDGLVYAAEFAGFLHCLDAETGQQYWEHDLRAEVWGSPHYVDGKVYIGDGRGRVTVFRPGKEKKVLAINENLHGCQVKWASPVAADGRVFVGTNNGKPRDPSVTGDKSVLMCFRESDGAFLWQIVHDKLDNTAIDPPPESASPRRPRWKATDCITSATAAS